MKFDFLNQVVVIYLPCLPVRNRVARRCWLLPFRNFRCEPKRSAITAAAARFGWQVGSWWSLAGVRRDEINIFKKV